MRIHQTGNVLQGTNKYTFEVVTKCGHRLNGWDEEFKTFSTALRFAEEHGFHQ